MGSEMCIRDRVYAMPKVPCPPKPVMPPTAPQWYAPASSIPLGTPAGPANPFYFIGEGAPQAESGSFHSVQEAPAEVQGWDDWDERWIPPATASTVRATQFREKELKFKASPTPKNFTDWWLNSAARIRSAAARPDDSAQVWIAEVRNPAITIAELANRGTFYSLDSMISAALDEVISGLLKQEFQLLEIQLNSVGQSLAGRVKLRMLCDQFSIPKEASQDQAVRVISTTFLSGGFAGVRQFLTAWDEVVMAGSGAITEYQLRTNFRAQLQGVEEFKLDCLLYDRLEPSDAARSYTSLRKAVDLVVEGKRRAAIEAEIVPGRRTASVAAVPAIPKHATATNPSSAVPAAASPSTKASSKNVGRSSNRSISVPKTTAEKAKMPCFSFQAGKRTKGTSCPYFHGTEVVSKAAARPKAQAKSAKTTAKSSTAGGTPRSEQVCFDFRNLSLIHI